MAQISAPQEGLPQISSETTTKSFYVGIVVSILIGIAVAIIATLLIKWGLPVRRYSAVRWANPLFSISLGAFCGVLIFVKGRFEQNLGERGFGEVWGVPFAKKEGNIPLTDTPYKSVHFGPGIGWLPPVWMTYSKQTSAAKTVSPPKEEYLTQDALPVTLEASGSYEVLNVVAAGEIQASDIPTFVQNQFGAAVRKYVASRPAALLEVLRQSATPGQASQLDPDLASKLLAKLATFKNGLTADGPEEIQALANHGHDMKDGGRQEGLHKYGITLSSVQIKNVRLTVEIETAINNIFKEIVDAFGVLKDAGTKRKAANVLLEVYKDNGVNLLSLRPSERAAAVQMAIDAALANEGKAQIKRINFGGQAPAGYLIDDRDDNNRRS